MQLRVGGMWQARTKKDTCRSGTPIWCHNWPAHLALCSPRWLWRRTTCGLAQANCQVTEPFSVLVLKVGFRCARGRGGQSGLSGRCLLPMLPPFCSVQGRWFSRHELPGWPRLPVWAGRAGRADRHPESPGTLSQWQPWEYAGPPGQISEELGRGQIQTLCSQQGQ